MNSLIAKARKNYHSNLLNNILTIDNIGVTPIIGLKKGNKLIRRK